jgi:hypothetical protein
VSQVSTQDRPVGWVVVHNENGKTAEHFYTDGLRFAARQFLKPESQLEMESAALAGFAFHPEVSSN